MTIHIEFDRDHRGTQYTFYDRHTKEPLAFGEYTPDGFVLLDKYNSKSVFKTAALAWRDINEMLTHDYGY